MRMILVCSAWALLALFPLAARAQDLPEYNPLGDIADQMKVATVHLSKLTTGEPTQTAQGEAIRKLDVLIEELQKQSQGQGRINANPKKPANASVVRQGPGGSGALHAARVEGKQWGDLPDHERERILQSMTQGFPPHYQAILERYYKRLAEEQSASGGEGAGPVKEDAKGPPEKKMTAPAMDEKK